MHYITAAVSLHWKHPLRSWSTLRAIAEYLHYFQLSLITSSALVCAVPLPRQETCASLQVLYAAGTFEAGLGTTGLALKSAVTSLVSEYGLTIARMKANSYRS